jgi:hypothetical protein
MTRSPSPPTPAPATIKRRGRPPRPGGPIPKAEVQRAYRERLRAAGKAVKLVDADWDSDEFRALFAKRADDLHNALLILEVQKQDIARLEQRNAYLERELRLEAQHHTNALKDNIVLKKQLAEITRKPPRRR